MSKLTDGQRAHIRNFLRDQGLTFEPLAEELLDHMASDIEERMDSGLTFENAWLETRNEIPQHHLHTLQLETMETINKRFTISRSFSVAALGLLFTGTIFKVMHLAGASQLLLLSFIAMAAGLLSSTVWGIYNHKEKKGAGRILSVVVGTMLLMMGYGFKVLHWPGADQLIIFGSLISLCSLLYNTFYVYRSRGMETNLLSYLHEKYTPGIERFFLIILIPVGIYCLFMLSQGQAAILGTIPLVIVIYGASLQLFALTWRKLESDQTLRSIPILTATALSIVCLTLVIQGPIIPLTARLIMIGLYSIATAWVVYQIEPYKNIFIRLVIALIPVLFVGRMLLGLQIILVDRVLIFNIPILIVLTSGVFVSHKHGPARTFFIMSIASYLLEYMITMN